MAATDLAGARALANEWIEGVYNRRDPAALARLASGAVAVSGDYLGALLALAALPDARATVRSVTAEGDRASVVLSIAGTHRGVFDGVPPTGRAVRFDKVDLLRFNGGRVVEAAQSWDRAALAAQLRAGAGVAEPLLAVREIQGNGPAGFNKNWQAFLFLRVCRAAPARAWLRELEPRIATLEDVIGFNRLYKAIRARSGRGTPTVRATWINVAFTADGLAALGTDPSAFTEPAFREGMHRRSALLGDPTDPAAAGFVENWDVGSSDRVPHLVVMVASDEPGWLGDEVLKLLASLNDGLELLFLQNGAALPFPLTGHEHFGFKDGVSQPGIRGRLSDAPDDYLTARQNPDNPNQGKPGQALVWPGEFVFGYPEQDPVDPLRPGPASVAGPAWARDGSYLVFRKLRQEVGGFDAWARTTAADLRRRHPALASLTPEALQAKVIGRWVSGAPLSRAPGADEPALGADDCANNHFDFSQASRPIRGTGEGCTDDRFAQAPADPSGVFCPHAAHIRKAYPRAVSVPSTQRHRLLRRGVAYGPLPPADADRGLLFWAYQTSFERQFEFVTRQWLNNPSFPGPGAGFDPLLGQNGAPGRARAFSLAVDAGGGRVERVQVDVPADFVVPRAGAYFFAPSLSAIRMLAGV